LYTVQLEEGLKQNHAHGPVVEIGSSPPPQVTRKQQEYLTILTISLTLLFPCVAGICLHSLLKGKVGWNQIRRIGHIEGKGVEEK
jgi:hypothetical protein